MRCCEVASPNLHPDRVYMCDETGRAFGEGAGGEGGQGWVGWSRGVKVITRKFGNVLHVGVHGAPVYTSSRLFVDVFDQRL